MKDETKKKYIKKLFNRTEELQKKLYMALIEFIVAENGISGTRDRAIELVQTGIDAAHERSEALLQFQRVKHEFEIASDKEYNALRKIIFL